MFIVIVVSDVHNFVNRIMFPHRKLMIHTKDQEDLLWHINKSYVIILGGGGGGKYANYNLLEWDWQILFTWKP